MLPAEGVGLSRKDPGVVTAQAKGTACAEPRGAMGQRLFLCLPQTL